MTNTTNRKFPDIVVTGMAMTTALATDAEGTWQALLDGRSGIRTLEDSFVEQFDLPIRIGGHYEDRPWPRRVAAWDRHHLV